MKLVPAARFKIDHVHNTVRLLQQVERSFVLLPLDESISTVVQLSQNYRDLILRYSELFIVVLVKGIIFVDRARSLVGTSCIVSILRLGTSNGRSGTSYWRSCATCPRDSFLRIGSASSCIALICRCAFFITTAWYGLTINIGGDSSASSEK